MPYFFLPPDEIKFPPGHFADLDGLLAQGGDLTADWIIAGYQNGVFLWSSPMEPLKWFCPDPRVVIFPDQLSRIEYPAKYHFEFNSDLTSILDYCEALENKKEMNPAWVTGKFKQVYSELDQRGFVHSVQIKEESELIGVAFGSQIGRVFFMEYVSGKEEKIRESVLIALVNYLKDQGIQMIDVHKETNLTIDIGYSEISRNEYLDLLKKWI